MKIIEICGFSRRVADLLAQLSIHLTGERPMNKEDLDQFITEENQSREKLTKAFLVIFNACARRFSTDADLK